MKTFAWDPQKNELLLRERGVSFEAIIATMTTVGVLSDAEHPNQEKYPGQRIFVVLHQGYAYMVPYRETETELKLVTIIPSRKATRAHLMSEDKP